jgi:hypothetical protein
MQQKLQAVSPVQQQQELNLEAWAPQQQLLVRAPQAAQHELPRQQTEQVAPLQSTAHSRREVRPLERKRLREFLHEQARSPQAGASRQPASVLQQH